MQYWLLDKIFNKPSKPRQMEFLAVDENFRILDTSDNVQRFADCPQEVKEGNDVRFAFPELFGMEDLFNAILLGQQESFELKGIARGSDPGHSLYMDLYVIADVFSWDEETPKNGLLIFLEDVTEKMVLEQSLMQSSNETHLLVSSLTGSKAYLDKIITAMSDALLVTTKSGKIKTVNKAAKELFGYSESELIARSISLIILDDRFFQAGQQQPSLAQSEGIEVACQTKTGQKLTVSFSCSALQTDIEDLQDFVYIGRDITERKRIQRRLAAQYATTRILSETANLEEVPAKVLQAICESLEWDLGELWTTDQSLGVLPLSPSTKEASVFPVLRCVETWSKPSVDLTAFTNVTGQTTCAPNVGLPGRVWATGSPQWMTDVAQDVNFWRSHTANNTGIHAAFGFPILDGSEVLGVMTFYSCQVQPPDEDLLEMMAAIGCQLGQFVKRKRAEAALSESEERYRDLFENASDLIQSVDLNGRFLYVNRAWRQTLGYTEAEIAKLSVFDILHPNCKAKCQETFSRVMSGENIDKVEAVFISKNGQKISVEGSINGKFVDKKPVATRAIFRDITERLKAEAALRQQQEQTERLLLNILPEPIAERLKQDDGSIADHFAAATVLFADIVGFTPLASRLSPIKLVNLLNQIFSTFDLLTEQHGLEKIKTVGDAYMVVGGIPIPKPDHAQAVAEMALDMQQAIAEFSTRIEEPLNIRIGINTGPVVAGVIGIKKFIYDLWGDTVNTASRMESHGLAGMIQVTEATYQLLRDRYLFEERGVISVKGKGEMTTYFLLGRKSNP